MRWLLAVGLALFAVIMAEGVAGYGGATLVNMDDSYIAMYMEKMRYAAKDKMDEKYNSYFTIEPEDCTKQDVNGYLFEMNFLAYGSDSKGKMMTKDCKMSMHFFHDGKTEEKITKGPKCKDV